MLLTLREAAEVLRISYGRAAVLARENAIPAVVRLPRRVLVRRDALEEFIERGGIPQSGGWRRKSSWEEAA